MIPSELEKLDENRTKNNCKYAILVSNLEGNNPNISPIYKVREYENMYVVRPAYMMVLLNLIASLTSRFAKLLLMKEAEDLELKENLTTDDKILTLSTCLDNNKRLVVHAVLLSEEDNIQ